MNIVPYEKNAKRHPKEQIRLIAKSLQRFGWQQPIKIGKDGVILVGHGRWLAYQEYVHEYKLSEPWVIDENGKTISGKAETRKLTLLEEKAYRLADNQINALSDSDMSLALEDLKLLDSDLFEITGFDSDLLVEDDADDDVVPEAPETPVSKAGDVYEMGSHRLMCGDSTKDEDVSLLMNGVKADMIFTDPPYNVDYSGKGKKTKKGIMNDNMDSKDFDVFLLDVFARFGELSKAGAPWYVFHSQKTQDQFKTAIEATPWKIKTQLIWNKPSAGLGMNEYRQKHEPFFYCVNKSAKFYGDRSGTTIWDFHKYEGDLANWAKKILAADKAGKTTIWTMKREPVTDYVHPTQKPVELIGYALHNSSKAGDLVADLFLGSGATLIACEKFGRSCYGMEMDEKYVDVIVQRWVDYTGIEKVKRNGKIITWTKTIATEKTTENEEE